MASSNNNKAYFDEILGRQTLSAVNLPKSSLSSVGTYDELDRYYDEVMAQESESRSFNKMSNRTPFYLKMDIEEIELPRREPPQQLASLQSNYNQTF